MSEKIQRRELQDGETQEIGSVIIPANYTVEVVVDVTEKDCGVVVVTRDEMRRSETFSSEIATINQRLLQERVSALEKTLFEKK